MCTINRHLYSEQIKPNIFGLLPSNTLKKFTGSVHLHNIRNILQRNESMHLIVIVRIGCRGDSDGNQQEKLQYIPSDLHFGKWVKTAFCALHAVICCVLKLSVHVRMSPPPHLSEYKGSCFTSDKVAAGVTIQSKDVSLVLRHLKLN